MLTVSVGKDCWTMPMIDKSASGQKCRAWSISERIISNCR